jgi:hypothetical protein
MHIKSLSYKLNSADAFWKKIPFRQDSLVFLHKSDPVRQGNLNEVLVTAFVPFHSEQKDNDFTKLSSLHGLFALTSFNNDTLFIGTDNCKAAFTFEKTATGKPGSAEGYSIKIHLKSTPEQSLQSFAQAVYGGNIAITD